jgi:flagellar L-ring protein precursor FlgH
MKIRFWLSSSLLFVLLVAPLWGESLWLKATNDENGIYGRAVASRRGDLVTVQVSETAKFSTTGITANLPGRTSALQNELLRVLQGVGKNALKLGTDAAGANVVLQLDELLSGNFQGGAGTLSSDISVSSYPLTSEVVDVLPNGNLVIAGAKTVSIGEEDLIVVLSGVGRPEDINQANTISSSHLAHARVEFVLEGTLSDVQTPGWLSKFINRANPF